MILSHVYFAGSRMKPLLDYLNNSDSDSDTDMNGEDDDDVDVDLDPVTEQIRSVAFFNAKRTNLKI